MHVNCLGLDGKGEDFSNEILEYLYKKGIQRWFSCTYTLQQNVATEWKNRHTIEIGQALMVEKNMPHNYWVEVVCIADSRYYNHT